MTNPSKDKGTRAETAVLRYARDNGFPDADRRPLNGRLDEGDILLCAKPPVILEVKAGKQAQQASYNQILNWLEDTERERLNAGAILAALVVQTRGYGPGRVESWNFWWIDTFARPAAACVRLADGLYRLRYSGAGEPTPNATDTPSTRDASAPTLLTPPSIDPTRTFTEETP